VKFCFLLVSLHCFYGFCGVPRFQKDSSFETVKRDLTVASKAFGGFLSFLSVSGQSTLGAKEHNIDRQIFAPQESFYVNAFA
jgi:hypothetical protein